MRISILIFLFVNISYSQVLWTVDTDKPATNWKHKTEAGEKYFYKYNAGDFDIVLYRGGAFAFQRTAPGETMFDECYRYLTALLGEPSVIKDFSSKYSDTFNLSPGAQVFAGMKKFWRGWETETKYISLEWDREMLQVICTAK